MNPCFLGFYYFYYFTVVIFILIIEKLFYKYSMFIYKKHSENTFKLFIYFLFFYVNNLKQTYIFSHLSLSPIYQLFFIILLINNDMK